MANTEYRRPHTAAHPQQRQLPLRFLIEICRPDGRVERELAMGGSSIDHAAAGMERGGLGSVVRVQPLALLEAA